MTICKHPMPLQAIPRMHCQSLEKFKKHRAPNPLMISKVFHNPLSWKMHTLSTWASSSWSRHSTTTAWDFKPRNNSSFSTSYSETVPSSSPTTATLPAGSQHNDVASLALFHLLKFLCKYPFTNFRCPQILQFAIIFWHNNAWKASCWPDRTFANRSDEAPPSSPLWPSPASTSSVSAPLSSPEKLVVVWTEVETKARHIVVLCQFS